VPYMCNGVSRVKVCFFEAAVPAGRKGGGIGSLIFYTIGLLMFIKGLDYSVHRYVHM
jgi:hypothetical protein